MTIALHSVVIDCADAARVAAFWATVLGRRMDGEPRGVRQHRTR
ncbi:VOC family protein [Tenggerimyces flavus]|uniref:VOC family protein n=1 Tax=Tenggerimyces flavus TaxID=1708749 RepID=A0ABV7YS23_9ACTN